MAESRGSARPPAKGAVEAGRRLRSARLAAGLTQTQLADLCGVTRQAVAGAEAGVWSPSLSGALALARALGTTVDELFAPDIRVQEVPALSLAPESVGRVRLVRVFDRWVALPLAGDRAATMGFSPASGQVRGANAPAELWGSGRSILVAGCDPALPLLAAPLEGAGDGWTLDWWPCGSSESERLLGGGLVHAAAVHYPIAERRRQLGDSQVVSVGFAQWREGLLLRPGGSPVVDSLEQAVRAGLRWVNRAPGAQARTLLDRELKSLGVDATQLAGYSSEAGGHLQLGSAIASGLADVGIATEPTALAYRLRFLPLSEEESVIRVDRARMESPEVRMLLSILRGPQLRRELEALAGYQPAILGEELTDKT